LIVALTLAACGLAATASLLAAQGESAAGGGPSFGKKVLVVTSLQGIAQTLVVIEAAEVKQLGGRAFLVGRGLHFGPNGGWYNGKRAWIPLEHVAEILEYDSVEALAKEPRLRPSE
jgi:hypothetical protein